MNELGISGPPLLLGARRRDLSDQLRSGGASVLSAIRPWTMLPHGLHWRKILLLLAVILIASWARDAFADPIAGRASVVDGDTIEIQGQRIRLNGIDAPESRQLCLDVTGKKYRCGQKAALALADYIAQHQPVSCIEVDRDRYKRVVAVCTAGGTDLADWMVRQGHALDWPRYSDGAYVSAQREARSARRGMWTGTFALPWEWRKQKAAAPMSSAGGGS